MSSNQRYQDNLKKFVMANPDIKNRANIDEKKNKEEFTKLGKKLEGILNFMGSSQVSKEDAEMKVEEIMANLDAYMRYNMHDHLRFNQQDREQVKDEMNKIRISLERLRKISPGYSSRIDQHIQTLNELSAMSGGIKLQSSDAGIYDDGEAMTDQNYEPSIMFRINNQMKLKRNPNYLPSKMVFNNDDE